MFYFIGEKIGEFLSRKENQASLQFYFDKFDLHRPIVKAIRIALSGSLHLPAEGELIDHIVEAFATIYTSQNPGAFKSVSSAHILCYAIILLNSDIHNPNVYKHMTQEEFIQNIRPSISNTELTDMQLGEIYRDIRQTPISFNSSASDQFLALCAPKLRGFLKKKTDKWNSFWTDHFFVLTKSCLYYFQDDSSKSKDSPLGMIQLIGCEVTMDSNHPLQIKIKCAKGQTSLQFVKFKGVPTFVHGVTQVILEAPNENSAQKWFYRLRQSVVCSNFNPVSVDPNNNTISSGLTDLTGESS